MLTVFICFVINVHANKGEWLEEKRVRALTVHLFFPCSPGPVSARFNGNLHSYSSYTVFLLASWLGSDFKHTSFTPKKLHHVEFARTHTSRSYLVVGLPSITQSPATAGKSVWLKTLNMASSFQHPMLVSYHDNHFMPVQAAYYLLSRWMFAACLCGM